MGARRPSLARQVRLLIVGVGIIFVVVIAGLTYSVAEFRDDVNRREQLIPAVTDTSRLSTIFAALLDDSDTAQVVDSQEALVLLGRLERELVDHPEVLDDLALIRSDLLSWRASVRLAADSGAEPSTEETRVASTDTQDRLMGNLVQRTGVLTVAIDRAADDAVDIARASRTRLLRGIGLAGAVALVLLVGGVTLLRRWFITPVLELVDGVAAIADGDHTHELRVDGSRELVELADSVSRMRDRILAERDRAVRAVEAVDQQAPAVAALRTLLAPRVVEGAAGVVVAGDLVPAEGELAGDWYDLGTRGDVTVVTLGDVCGHGVDAGVLAVRTKFALLDAMLLGLDPAAALDLAARRFARNDTFVTAMVVEIDPVAGRCRFASAGHNPGLLIHPDGSVDELPRTGPLIGLIDGPRTCAEVSIGPGDTVVLYTDGVIEARDADGAQLGVEGLVDVIRVHGESPPDRIVEAVTAAVLAHCGSRCTDDATVVVARLDQA